MLTTMPAAQTRYFTVPCDACRNGWIDGGADLCEKCGGDGRLLIAFEDVPHVSWIKSIAFFGAMFLAACGAWFGIAYLFLRALGVW